MWNDTGAPRREGMTRSIRSLAGAMSPSCVAAVSTAWNTASMLSAASASKRARRLGSGREAFNSPFRPFVLATTSIGQEGLDFHPYCYRVYHWNLPGNPVDLEQREGRVHRFKGHAVRLNVAHNHAADLIGQGH